MMHIKHNYLVKHVILSTDLNKQALTGKTKRYNKSQCYILYTQNYIIKIESKTQKRGNKQMFWKNVDNSQQIIKYTHKGIV